jgi:ligand-binding sensor domain-containing protein/serine phosphatase RsbU (regulator of sigma subunit)
MQRLIPALFIALLSFPAFSQQNNFRTYTIRDGLPQSTIYCIEQDARGFLWLGTEGGGLSRFDGNTFVNYTTQDGLSGNVVRSLFEDSNGNLWIGTDKGITLYDGIKFQSPDTALDLSGTFVLNFMEDHNHHIWAATNKQGAVRFKRTDAGFDLFGSGNGLVSDFVFDAYEDSENRIWLAMVGGINIITFAEDTFRVDQLRRAIQISGKRITTIEEDREGFLWFGSLYSGVIRLKPTAEGFTGLEILNTSSGITEGQIWDIETDHAGRVWIATSEGGINIIADDGIHYFTEYHGLPGNQVQCLFRDEEQNMWIGNMGNGLTKFMGRHFSHYGEKEGLTENNITGIVQDLRGNYWIATYGGGLVKLTIKDDLPYFEWLTTENGLLDNYLSSVFLGDDGAVWFSYVQSGAGRIDGSRITHLSKENGLIDDRVNCIFQDSRGDFWFGTKGGVSNYNKGGFINLDKSQISDNEVQAVLEDKAGHIWIGTLNGLSRFDRESSMMSRYDEVEGLTNKIIHCLAEDHAGNIWIGTFGGGLFLFDQARTDSLPIRLMAGKNKLVSNNIYSLVFQDDSVLIVGTDKGFDKVKLNGEGEIVFVRNYDETDGFTGVETNQNAILKDKAGNIWFGTVNGLTCYKPEYEHMNTLPPRLHISGIKIWFEDIDWSDESMVALPWFNVPEYLKLGHSDNHITFNISGISLTNPEKVKYRYLLDGLSENWSPPYPNTEVVYQGLKPGKYSFRVKAVNESGIWSEEPVTYDFTIKPPFWRTWWFFSLVLIFIGICIISWVKYRERQLRRKNKELEIKVLERTVEIRKQKAEIEEKNRNLEQANVEISYQKDIIESKNRDITASIKYAKRIQDALLPSRELLKESVSDSFIFFKPRDIVSGDFYWVKRKNSELIVVAADCTGHGVPGAFMSMLGMSFLDEIIDKDDVRVPGLILNRLRKSVMAALKQKDPGAESKDGMDLGLCNIDFNKNKLSFSGAHNPLWFIREGEVTEIKADRMPVAIHENMNDFTTHEKDLKKGDTIYIFSDGFPDQFGGPKGKKFKYRPFQELLLSIQDKTMEEQNSILSNTFDEWKGDLYQVDDVVVVGMRY